VLYCGCLRTIYVCTLAIIGMVENGSGVRIYPADFPSTPAPPKVPVLARYSVPMLYIGPKLDVLSPRTDLTVGNFRKKAPGWRDDPIGRIEGEGIQTGGVDFLLRHSDAQHSWRRVASIAGAACSARGGLSPGRSVNHIIF